MECPPTKPIVLARNGSLSCAIRMAQPTHPVHRFAARELRRYLTKCVGAWVPSAGGARILLDAGNAAQDGFDIATRDGDIHIYGRNARSLLFAVYAFLKRCCGCRWPHPGEECIIHHTSLTFSLSGPWSEASPFKRRNIYPEGGAIPLALVRSLIDWAPKNCIGDVTISISAWPKWRGALAPHIEKRGLNLNLSGHCLSQFVPLSEFDKHPDWFALIDGKRTGKGQYCFSSSSFRRALNRRMADWLAAEPLAQRVSVWARDNALICECPACSAAGFLRSFAGCIDEVAQECRRKRPDVSIDFLAYNAALAWDMLEPSGELGLTSCSTELAHWGRDYRHSLAAPRTRDDRRALECIRDWRRKGRHSLGVLEYYTDLWMHSHLITPLPTRIAQDCRALAREGVDAVATLIVLCVESLGDKDRARGRFAPKVFPNLHFFAASAWDPNRSTSEIVDDYARARFGRDAELCVRYLRELERALQDVTSFNRELFRLRFVDVWTRDATPKEGGIKFLAQEWTPKLGWNEGEKRRFRACRRMVAALRRFEEKTGWPIRETDREARRRIGEFRDRWVHVRRRMEGLELQLRAQQAMMRGDGQTARECLGRALRVPDGLASAHARMCRKWLPKSRKEKGMA